MKNFLSIGTLQICSQTSAFLLTILLARKLGAESFGLYVFGISLLAYMNLFSDLGITTQGVKDTASTRFSIQDLLSNIVSTKITLSVSLFIPMITFLIFFLEGSFVEKLSIMIIIFIAVINCFNMGWYFNSKGRYFWYFGPKFISNLILIVYVLKYNASLFTVCLLLTFGEAIIAATSLYVTKKSEKFSFRLRMFTNFDLKYMKRSLDTSSVLVLDFILMNLIIIIPGFFGNYTEVTNLFIINKLFYIFFFPLKNLISLIFIPQISRRQNELLDGNLLSLIFKTLSIALFFSIFYGFTIIYFIEKLTASIFDIEISFNLIVLLIFLNFIAACLTLPLWLFRVALEDYSQKHKKHHYKIFAFACLFTFSMFLGYNWGGVETFLTINLIANVAWILYLFASLKNLQFNNFNQA